MVADDANDTELYCVPSFELRIAIDHIINRLVRSPEDRGHLIILGQQPVSAIEHEKHDIGLGNRLPGLITHLSRQALFTAQLNTGRINDNKRPIIDNYPLKVPISGHARGRIDNRLGGLGQAVKQCRFADVWTTDQGDRPGNGLSFRYLSWLNLFP